MWVAGPPANAGARIATRRQPRCPPGSTGARAPGFCRTGLRLFKGLGCGISADNGRSIWPKLLSSGSVGAAARSARLAGCRHPGAVPAAPPAVPALPELRRLGFLLPLPAGRRPRHCLTVGPVASTGLSSVSSPSFAGAGVLSSALLRQGLGEPVSFLVEDGLPDLYLLVGQLLFVAAAPNRCSGGCSTSGFSSSSTAPLAAVRRRHGRIRRRHE